jgi:large subunit ribosomal protein L2
MLLKINKPTSPGKRHTVSLFKPDFSKNKKVKFKSLSKSSKVNFNFIDFVGIVCSLEYDSGRTATIASIFNLETLKYFYIIAPDKLKIGDVIKSGFKASKKIGHTNILENIPVGTYLYCLAYKPNSLAKIARSAGTYSIIIEKTTMFAKVLVNSGKILKLSLKCFGTIGIVSNILQNLTQIGKAGRLRWLKKKIIVRGVAKNPIDHPHGGGEGKKSGIRKTPWGKSMSSKK